MKRASCAGVVLVALFMPAGVPAAADLREGPLGAEAVAWRSIRSRGDAQAAAGVEVVRRTGSKAFTLCATVWRMRPERRDTHSYLEGKKCVPLATAGFDQIAWTAEAKASLRVPVVERRVRTERGGERIVARRSFAVTVTVDLRWEGTGAPFADPANPTPVCIVYAPPFVWPCSGYSPRARQFVGRAATMSGAIEARGIVPRGRAETGLMRTGVDADPRP